MGASLKSSRGRRPAKRGARRAPLPVRQDPPLPSNAMPSPAEVEELGRKADALAESRDERRLKYVRL